MTFLRSILVGLLLPNPILRAFGQETWCGKNYRPGQPVVEPGGAYPVPQTSPVDEPLLLFRCTPKYNLFVHGDDVAATILVDIDITHTKMNGTSSFPVIGGTTGIEASEFLVTISTEHVSILAARVMPLGRHQKLEFPLLAIIPRKTPHALTCTARRVDRGHSRMANRPSFTAHSTLSYQLPNHTGSTVKIDSETRGLLVSTGSKEWRPIIPYGFYTAFDNYLAKNLSVLDIAVANLDNLVHPVPTFGNLTALELVLDRMEALGLWLMYDMRWSYKNLTALTEEVNRIKSRKNLLLWYTADEPDGWGDDSNDARRAYELINELDGYHPVSLVINCQDYHFRSYTTGTTDILLQDTYPIGINATHSTVYDTPCTPTFGDCGCDNCEGNGIAEIADRLDGIHQMLEWEGRTGVPVWSVVQAFGNQSFWDRSPTDREFVAQALTGLIHGAKGLVPWIAPTTEDISSVSPKLGSALHLITGFILSQDAVFSNSSSHNAIEAPLVLAYNSDALEQPNKSDIGHSLLHTGIWRLHDSMVLVLASNLGDKKVSFGVQIGANKTELGMLIDIGVVQHTIGDGQVWINLESLGSIAFIVLY